MRQYLRELTSLKNKNVQKGGKSGNSKLMFAINSFLNVSVIEEEISQNILCDIKTQIAGQAAAIIFWALR